MNILKPFATIKAHYPCRCCTKSAATSIKLESFINNCGDEKKTYKEILIAITNLDIPPSKENILPQQICMECHTQIVNSYQFIQQACKVIQLYIKLGYEHKSQEDFKSLQETLMQIKENPIKEDEQQPMNLEPLNMEFKPDEQREGIECSKQERYISEKLKDNNFSEDSDEPESLKDYDVSKEPAIRHCDICHKVYKNEQTLNIHKRYIHPLREDIMHVAKETATKYSCYFCTHSYVSKNSLRRHHHRKHPHKTFEEKIKTVKTTTKAQKPKEKERFLCNYCGKSYSLQSSLKTHVLSHTGERPYSCEICSKTFKRAMGLQMHRVIHSDEKPYNCDVCGKGFKLADKLKFHMRVHSELRPYKCPQCEKTFKYSSVLKSHMLMHTGELPFACKTCEEAFALRTSLNYHCLKNGHEK